MSNKQQEWLLMVGGASRGNSGDAGCGAAICDENGVVVKELSRYLGQVTNNVAEYEALLMGPDAVTELGRKKIRVQSDSQFGVRQLNGEYRGKMKDSRGFSSEPNLCCASSTPIVSSMCTAK